MRNLGTIGGSVANSDPAADYPAGVLGLGATVVTNARKIDADNFFTGLFTTALKTGEIITALSFPVPDQSAYVKFKQPASRFALVRVRRALRQGRARRRDRCGRQGVQGRRAGAGVGQALCSRVL